MALSKLDNLYRQVILDHTAHPHNKKMLANATVQVALTNPSCGDEITLSLFIKEGVIDGIGFDGQGCSISMASASMMTEAVKGKTAQEALLLIASFLELVQGKKEQIAMKQLGDAAILSGVAKFPARIKCATLAWKALEQALSEENK